VAYGGLTVSSVSLSNQDSQFLESRKFDIEEIARAFRVPLHLLQSTEKTTSWGTGVEQLNRAFVDYSLQDRLVRWQEELNLSFLSAADLDNGLYWKFDVSELVSGSNSDRAQYYQVMRNIGVMSINDVREAEGMNDIVYQDDDGEQIGDNYEQPFNGTGGTVQKEANEDPASEQKEAQAEAKEPPSAENESEQAEITKPKRKSKKKSATT
jgi:phage portal protein BeeE